MKLPKLPPTLICLLSLQLLILPVDAADPIRHTSNRPTDSVNDDTGVIEGRVTYEGAIPKARIADDGGSRRDLIDVDRKSRGLRYVIAYLATDADSGKDLTSSETSKPEKQTALIDQIDHEFVPHLIAVRAGQPVMFKNSDGGNHNVRTIAFEEKNQFNVFTGAGDKYEHQFRLERKNRPILINCNLHPWMRAWIFVFDHSKFAVTDEKGRFRISAVPVGAHRLVVRQPDLGFKSERAVTVSKGETTRVSTLVKHADLKLR